ncbi:MAG TPA: hypothetical protein VFT05_12410 [Burkholderiaceae bacterium]|nr:hypothetical protein [Burkholderiaceae bacterium]
MCKQTALMLLLAAGLAGSGMNAHAQSGQTAFGQATVEPAVNDADGSTVYLLTPSKAPLPSMANARATAPLYLPAYPSNSTINPATLNCQPHNCDHVNVLPFPAPGYPNGGAACVQYGYPANQCALLIGHDHLIGVPHTGDFNVAWSVILVVFTPEGLAAGAANHRTLTLVDVANLVTRGWAFEVVTPITFNCSIVPASLYYKGTPQSF